MKTFTVIVLSALIAIGIYRLHTDTLREAIARTRTEERRNCQIDIQQLTVAHTKEILNLEREGEEKAKQGYREGFQEAQSIYQDSMTILQKQYEDQIERRDQMWTQTINNLRKEEELKRESLIQRAGERFEKKWQQRRENIRQEIQEELWNTFTEELPQEILEETQKPSSSEKAKSIRTSLNEFTLVPHLPIPKIHPLLVLALIVSITFLGAALQGLYYRITGKSRLRLR